MGRKRALGSLPTLNDVASAMTNAMSHFRWDAKDIAAMAKAVKRLYEGRIAEQAPDYYEALRRVAVDIVAKGERGKGEG